MSVLMMTEQRVRYVAGGIIHSDEQDQPGASILQPVVVAPIDLYQHPFLWHALTTDPVTWRSTPTRALNRGVYQSASHRGAARNDSLALDQELSHVSMVRSLIAGTGQSNNLGLDLLGDSVARRSASITVSECCGSLLPIRRQDPPDVAFTHSQNLGRLSYWYLICQHPVEHLKSNLFSLSQCHVLCGRTAMMNPGPPRLGSDPLSPVSCHRRSSSHPATLFHPGAICCDPHIAQDAPQSPRRHIPYDRSPDRP